MLNIIFVLKPSMSSSGVILTQKFVPKSRQQHYSLLVTERYCDDVQCLSKEEDG